MSVISRSSQAARRHPLSRLATLATLASAVALLGSCAVNPATGRRELMLVSEDQEIAMGREYDPQIVASIGLYPDTALQRYVQQLGTRIAALSERPRLPWTFRVLDDPTVNAFAVPGGFIYITRGIMAHLDNEAQLASVIGHEIGHVTARHSASQMSKEQLAQLGLAVGAAASETFAQYAQVAAQGLGVLFLKYSRDDESQADDLGLRYLRLSRHDVREMPDVFAMLAAVSGGGEEGRLPEWQLTHPFPENRKAAIEARIARAPQDSAGVVIGRNDYLRRLDDVVFDADPRQGYFTGTRFIHPTMRFTLDFPAGWLTKNEASAVQAMSAEKDAAITLSIAEGTSADAAQRAFAGTQGITVGNATRPGVSGFTSVMTPFAAMAQADTVRGAMLFLEHGGTVFQLVGYAPGQGWAARQALVERALRSFAVLTDRTALNIQPQRIDVIALDRRSSLSELLTRRPSPRPIEELALINQVRAGEPLAQGTLVKWVVGPALPR